MVAEHRTLRKENPIKNEWGFICSLLKTERTFPWSIYLWLIFRSENCFWLHFSSRCCYIKTYFIAKLCVVALKNIWGRHKGDFVLACSRKRNSLRTSWFCQWNGYCFDCWPLLPRSVGRRCYPFLCVIALRALQWTRSPYRNTPRSSEQQQQKEQQQEVERQKEPLVKCLLARSQWLCAVSFLFCSEIWPQCGSTVSLGSVNADTFLDRLECHRQSRVRDQAVPWTL